MRNKVSRFDTRRSYLRHKAFYDVESLYNVFTAIFHDEYSGREYLVVDSDVELTQSDVDYLGLTIIGREQAEIISNKRQLVGYFNRKYDDYMLAEYFNGKGYRELHDLSKKIVSAKKPPFLWKGGRRPDDLFSKHTIDITLYIKMGHTKSLKQLASELGANVQEFELDFDVDFSLTKEEILKLIEYNINDVRVTKDVFNHESVKGWYDQHVAVIEKYLPESAWAIFMTNAQLSERALTKSNTIKVDMADKFNWVVNGIDVMEEIDLPNQWREEVLDYASKVEEGVRQYKQALAAKEDRPAKLGRKYIQSIPRPEVDPVKVTDRFYLKPGEGGLHSDYVNDQGVQQPVNVDNVLHSDIGGAYGTLALESNLFGDGTEVYRRFMDDKNKTKYASIEIQNTDFNEVDVPEFLSYIEGKYDVNLEGLTDKDEIVDKIMLEREASKLGTNSPTGKSDQPGSKIYNPVVIKQDRMKLQMIGYELCVKLAEAGAELFSFNTDGVFYKGDEKVLLPIVEAWADKWGFEVDSERIDRYVAKDDNNRVLIHNGEVIESAGELRHYEFDANYLSSVPRIVDVAITDKFLYPDKSIREIIESHTDKPELFAWTIKPTVNHKTAIDYEITQKINRVLLTTEGVNIQHYSVTKDIVEKFNNLPLDNTVTVINECIPETLPDNIDLDAYEELVMSRYQNWI